MNREQIDKSTSVIEMRGIFDQYVTDSTYDCLQCHMLRLDTDCLSNRLHLTGK